MEGIGSPDIDSLGKRVLEEVTEAVDDDISARNPFLPLSSGILKYGERVIYGLKYTEVQIGDSYHWSNNQNSRKVSKVFDTRSEQHFCEYLVKQKNISRRIRDYLSHNWPKNSTNKLLDDLIVSTVICYFLNIVLRNIERDRNTKWDESYSTDLDNLLAGRITLVKRLGLTNVGVFEHLLKDDKVNSKDMRLELQNGNVTTIFRSPVISDLPASIDIGPSSPSDPFGENTPRPLIPDITSIIEVRIEASHIPIGFHPKPQSWGPLPYYDIRIESSIAAFDHSFQSLDWKLTNAFTFISLLSSSALSSYYFYDYSVKFDNKIAYDDMQFKKDYRNENPQKTYLLRESSQNEKRRVEAIWNKLIKQRGFDRLFRSSRDEKNDQDKRIKGAYERYKDLVTSDKEVYNKIHQTVESLEKFYSQSKDGSKEETRQALKNIAIRVFNDHRNTSQVFNIAYCLRSKYAHNELTNSQIEECMLRLNKGKEKRFRYNVYAEHIYQAMIEMLRVSVLLAVISKDSAEEFTRKLATGRDPSRVIPLEDSKIVAVHNYLDSIIPYLLDL